MKTYIIKNKDDVTQDMIDVCIEDAIDTMRLSVDTILAVLKWSGSEPPIFSGETKYTHSEIIPIMHSSEWTESETP